MATRVCKRKDAFDLTSSLWQVANNICENVSDVSHINMQNVSVNYVRCKNSHGHGTLATLTPLRFENGAMESIVDGRLMRMQAVYDFYGHEVLYLLSIYLPRFTNLAFYEKLFTLAHELWHISVDCDGDLRRFPGKNYVHGNSEREFDLQAERIIHRWLATDPPEPLTEFLKYNLDELVSRYGRVIGQKFANPKLIPAE